MNYNKAILVGRLCGDPASKTTKNGKPYAGFQLAVNEGYGERSEASFFHVRVWGKAGEVVAKYCVKGGEILVEGSLKQNRWEDAKGKHDMIVLNAWNVELGARPREEQRGGHGDTKRHEEPAATKPDSYATDNIAPDDTPF